MLFSSSAYIIATVMAHKHWGFSGLKLTTASICPRLYLLTEVATLHTAMFQVYTMMNLESQGAFMCNHKFISNWILYTNCGKSIGNRKKSIANRDRARRQKINRDRHMRDCFVKPLCLQRNNALRCSTRHTL